MRSATGTGGGDRNGLLATAALGDRARGTHTKAGAKAGHINEVSGTAHGKRGLGGNNEMKMNGSPHPLPLPLYISQLGN